MKNKPSLTRKDLLSYFVKSEKATEKIGIEVELGVVDTNTGISLPYDGNRGAKAILEVLMKTDDWHPIYEENLLIGLVRADKTQVVLESGGQIEYASPPAKDLVELVQNMRQVVLKIAEVARGLGTALIAGSMLPFDKLEDGKVIPKPRYQMMLDYLSSLNFDTLVLYTMTRTLSTQVTFDYLSEDDMNRKVRSLLSAAPVSSALFANSPIESGTIDGILSHRAKYYLKLDPARCGCIPCALNGSMTFEDYIDWAMEIPAIASVVNGVCQPMHGRTFSSLLNSGFSDGSQPTFDNWQSHFSSIYTDIRLRNTIEIRAIDGQAFEHIPSACAFWTGLVYHQPSLESLWKLFQNRTLEDYQKAQAEVCVHGLKAKYGKDSVQELAIEMVQLAKQGLSARVNAGLEHPEVLTYLEPVEEVASSGQTFAERLTERWKGELQSSPAKYVKAFEIS
ncbi:MAG: glutamate-cysteine ligase family protein [Nostocaceae cyanobacterium]|nr:glutamate-cysteine ligase family protein [Nostocaceae cyanobacterium]